MTRKNEELGVGDNVKSKEFGAGVVLSVESVELPSDGDHTFYRVQMADGIVRNLKASQLGGGGFLD